jgi:Ca-activated chloride channel family protein
MNKARYTYRLKSLFAAVIAWEILFWLLAFGALLFLGFFNLKNGQTLAFRHEGLLWLNLLLIPLFLIYFYQLIRSNQIAAHSDPRLRPYLLTPVSSSKQFLKYFFFRNTFVLLVFALAQPLFGSKKVSATVESMELVIGLDVSSSMNVKDISRELSRLDISKRALVQLINNLHGEKIGICVFAGGAYVQLPLTSDYGAAKMFVNDIQTSMISNQGTNITAALETALDMFTEQKTSKGIILVTDGEHHEENPDKILGEIKEKSIGLAVLGIGTSSGGPVPHNPERPELGYKTNAVGVPVVSKVDPGFIRSIASKGGGKAVISTNEFPDMRELLTEINQMKRTKVRDLQFDTMENRYRIPLLGGLICWIAYLLLFHNFVRLKRTK